MKKQFLIEVEDRTPEKLKRVFNAFELPRVLFILMFGLHINQCAEQKD
jgi:hypothetical protein